MNLLLVDGSNMIMRAAFGGDIEPERAVPIATGLILRAARQVQASHLILALDSPGPSWRKQADPTYKANRTRDTAPWLQAAFEGWTRAGFYVEAVEGFEADDILATLAARARQHRVKVLSGDSDLVPLLDLDATLLRPVNGGVFEEVTRAEAREKWNIAAPSLLVDLKAMTGETGDNIAGVPGIGPVKAAKLIAAYGSLDGTIEAGRAEQCKESKTVFAHQIAARQAFKLLTLRQDVPIMPVKPSSCFLNQG
jgi:DNA polymerase-1